MSNKNDALEMFAKKYADELALEVEILISESRESRNPKPMISVLRPLIDAISRVRVATEWTRIPGFSRCGAD